MGVLLALFAAALLMDRAVIARHRAGAAADLAALAAADHALDGAPAACGLAARVASAQGATVVGCTVTGEIADITARVGPAQAHSRAGPPNALVPPDPPDPSGPPGRPGPPGPPRPLTG
jgi:secretion/DNA translocation related TadE-like protein